MIQAEEHLNTDKIVSIDVEYGGGRTVPRIAIVNFNEEVLYWILSEIEVNFYW